MHASTAALLLGLPTSLIACYWIAHWSRASAARLYTTRCASARSLADEENQVLARPRSIRRPTSLGPLAVTLCGMLLFVCVSFVHEWIQESMQIYGEQQALLRVGPPSSCEPASPRDLVSWITSKSDLDRILECQHYYDAIYRLPLANPLSALVSLCAGLLIQPCLLFYRNFIHNESYVTQSIFCITGVLLAHACLTHVGRACARIATESYHGGTSSAGTESNRSRRAQLRSFEPKRQSRDILPLQRERDEHDDHSGTISALWTLCAENRGIEQGMSLPADLYKHSYK
jgi:hypothetical protein